MHHDTSKDKHGLNRAPESAIGSGKQLPAHPATTGLRDDRPQGCNSPQAAMGSEQVIRVSNNAMVQVDFEWDVDATGPVGRPSAPEANPHAAAIPESAPPSHANIFENALRLNLLASRSPSCRNVHPTAAKQEY
jgi:hypothetical protein